MSRDLLYELRVFVAVCEHGSLSAASPLLHRTPSSLGKALAHLQARLGAQLIQLTTRSATLSASGERLLPHARQILRDLDAIPSIVHGTARPIS